MKENFMVYNIEEILPHRKPFLFLKKILSLNKGKYIRAVNTFHINEDFFAGHFPNNPIVPGVLLIEAMAQASAALLCCSFDEMRESQLYLASVENAKFTKPVQADQELLINAHIIRARQGAWKFRTKVFFGVIEVSEATLLIMTNRNVTRQDS